jgi:hypothetical protein
MFEGCTYDYVCSNYKEEKFSLLFIIVTLTIKDPNPTLPPPKKTKNKQTEKKRKKPTKNNKTTTTKSKE